MDKSPKPTPVKSMLKPTLVFLALFFVGMGYLMWTAKLENDKKMLEARGMENFNSTQMEVWNECEKIGARMQEVFELVHERIGLDNWTAARQLLLPKECKFLEDLAKRTYAERVRSEGR